MNKILSIAICATALLACQEMQSQKEMIQIVNGYKCSVAKDEAGETVKAGQYALIHAVMCVEDSVLSDTRVSPGRPSIVKVDPKETRKGSSAPVQGLLEMMSVGDSARLYYPLDSFPQKPPRLKDFEEITYDIVLVDIFETEEELQKYMEAERERVNAPLKEAQAREAEVSQSMATFHASYKRGEKDSQWQTTPSGFKYLIIEKSSAKRKPQKGELVRAHYYGIFEADGKPFDNSFSRGNTYNFPLGQGEVIAGWDEGFALLDKGDKAVFLVPSDLAYGSQGYPGAIPPNASLLFYVELVGIGDLD